MYILTFITHIFVGLVLFTKFCPSALTNKWTFHTLPNMWWTCNMSKSEIWAEIGGKGCLGGTNIPVQARIWSRDPRVPKWHTWRKCGKHSVPLIFARALNKTIRGKWIRICIAKRCHNHHQQHKEPSIVCAHVYLSLNQLEVLMTNNKNFNTIDSKIEIISPWDHETISWWVGGISCISWARLLKWISVRISLEISHG